MNRLIAATLAALTLLMGCGRGSGPSPEQVAVKWRWAFEKGDAATEWELRAPGTRGSEDRAAGIAFLRSLYKPLTPDHQVVAIKATRTVKDTSDPKNTFVFLYLQVTERAYPPGQETVTLRKVGGAWRVAKWQP
ncbi:MAG TPA: hypothetical protein VHL53_03610 [Acidimicrobiia bacterium]|nr:hypothetical protein [Acidimicrobiia bacterium]